MKKKFIRFFLMTMLIASVSAFAVQAKAATYYVSPSGSDTNDGSQATPFNTIQHAADTVSAGDTVIVEDGTYTGLNNSGGDNATVYISRSGTAGAPITFKSQNKWGAVLDGQNDSVMFGIFIAANYINVEGFTVQNYRNGGIAGGVASNPPVSYVTVYGNQIRYIGNHSDTYGNGSFGTDFENGSSYLTIDSNVIYDTHSITAKDEAINFEYGNDNYITIINNIVYNPNAWDVQFYNGSSSNVTIVGNVFTAPLLGSQIDGEIILSKSGGMPNLLIEDNIFYDPYNNYAVRNDIGVNYTSSNNFTTASAMDSAGVVGANNILDSDPLFANAGSHDYHLASAGSPAYHAGITWSGRAYDADGNPVANPPDIGAYEYSSAGSSTGTAQVVAPQLLTPTQGQSVATTVTFTWSPAQDSSLCTYKLYVDTDQNFSNATPIQVASAQKDMYAKGKGAAALLLFGLAIPAGIRRKRKLSMLMLVGLMAAGLLVSCGGGGGGSASSSPAAGVSPSSSAMSYTVSGLSSGTTYYWKVVAQDNSGKTLQSQVGTFQTK